MVIRVEPRDFFMSTVFLIFTRHQPDPEDDEVKHYLAEHALEPRRAFDTAYQERDCTIWQFGGCYLGQHLKAISDIQGTYLEAEILAEEVSRLLKEGADAGVREVVEQLPDARLQELVNALVQEFHQESSFGPDADGNVRVTLDSAVVQGRFKELAQSHVP
jgi:hypothetical protein